MAKRFAAQMFSPARAHPLRVNVWEVRGSTYSGVMVAEPRVHAFSPILPRVHDRPRYCRFMIGHSLRRKGCLVGRAPNRLMTHPFGQKSWRPIKTGGVNAMLAAAYACARKSTSSTIAHDTDAIRPIRVHLGLPIAIVALRSTEALKHPCAR